VKELAETKVRGARASEHLKHSVGTELDRKERELEDLKTKYDQEREAAAATEARLQADLTHLREQNARLEPLRTEVQTTVDESFREVGQFYEISTALERALGAYTQAVEAVEARLLAVTKRLRELGISMGTPVSRPVEADPNPAVPEAAEPEHPPSIQPVQRGRRMG
jgi:chromosome segregation ATPase